MLFHKKFALLEIPVYAHCCLQERCDPEIIIDACLLLGQYTISTNQTNSEAITYFGLYYYLMS